MIAPQTGAVRGIAIGSVILAGFGALWLGLAVFYLRLNWKWLFLVALACAALVVGSVREMPGTGVATTNSHANEVGRLVGYASAAEGVAIFIAVLVLKRRAPRYIVTAIAIMVGLHFFPLALGLGFRIYFATGAVMVACAAALAFLRDDALRQGTTCVATGINLWLTALILLALPIA